MSGQRRARAKGAAVLALIVAWGALLVPSPPAASLAGLGPEPDRVAPGQSIARQVGPGPALYDEAVLGDDPLLYYRFDDSGSTVVDASGNGRHGTYAGSAAKGEAGALLDDGSASVRTTVSGTPPVGMSASGLPAGRDARTVEVWAKTTADDFWLVRYGTFGIKLVGTTAVRVALDIDTAINVTVPNPMTATVWRHIAVTLSGAGELTVYVDGQRIGTHVDPAVTTALSGAAHIGQALGSYDEVAIYDHVLTPEQVNEHWVRGASRLEGPTCPEDGGSFAPTDPYGESVLADEPITYLRMGEAPYEEGDGVAYDHSGGCRHAALWPETSLDDPIVLDGEGSLAQPALSPRRWMAVQGGLPFVPGDPMTVELWSDTATDHEWLFSLGGRFGLHLDTATSGRMIFAPGTEADAATAFTLPFPLVAGEWHHWAVTFDGERMSVFFDGIEVASQGGFDVVPSPIVVSDPGAPLRIGLGAGSFDEFALYPSAFTPTQVAARWGLGQGGLSGTCPTATGAYGSAVLEDEPVAFYRLGERTVAPEARVATDLSGACRHGALDPQATGTAGAVLTGEDGAATTTAGRWAAAASGMWLPTGSEPVTIDLWSKRSSSSSNLNRWLFSYGGRIGLYPTTSHNVRAYYGGIGFYVNVSLPYAHNDGEWHHFAQTYDGTTMRVYFDGALVGAHTVTVSTTPHGNALLVNDADSVDDLAIYPSVLSPEDVRRHWSVGRSDDGSACRSGSPSGHAQGVLDDGPLAFWRMSDVDAGGGGQVAFDLSGGCRNGAYERTVTATTGALNGDPDGAASLTSATSGCSGGGACRLTLSSSAHDLPGGTAPRTVEMWSSAQDAERWLYRYGERSGLYLLTTSHARLYWANGSSYTTINLGSAISVGWHHWAVTYDGSIARLYLDGVLKGSTPSGTTFGGTDPTGELVLGAAAGAYDEVAIFPRALTAQEVADRVADGQKADTSTALEGPDGAWTAEEEIDFAITVTPGDGSSGVPTGTVTLRDGGVPIGTATLDGGGEATITVELDEGSHAITATYEGSGTHVASRSEALTRDAKVLRQSTTEVTVAPSPALVGEPVTATVAVREIEVPPPTTPEVPAGQVELEVGGVTLPPLTLGPDGEASVELPHLDVGLHEVEARYLGSGDHLPSSSDVVEHHVNEGDVLVELSGPLSVPHSALLPVAVTVSPVAPAGGLPSGDVEIEVDGIVVDTLSLDEGEAGLVLDDREPGAYEIVARYLGGDGFRPAESEQREVVVTPAEAHVEVTTDPSPSATGQEVTVTVTAEAVAPATAVPDVAVQVYDGLRLLGTEPLVAGTSTITTSTLSEGAHVLRAVLVPSAHWAGSWGMAVHHVRLGVDMTLDEAPDTVWGQAATFVAAAASVDGGSGVVPTGTLRLVDDGTSAVLGQGELDGAGRVEIELGSLPVGTTDLVAEYLGDDRHVGGTSDPVEHVVAKAATHVTVGTTPNPSEAGQEVTLSAQVRVVTPGAGSPTGYVSWFVAGEVTPLATAAIGPTGTAAAIVTFPVVGSHAIVATYGGDASHLSQTSAAVTHRVEPSTTTEVMASPSTEIYGRPVTLTAEVTSPGGPVAGTVTFRVGEEVLGTDEVDGSGEAEIAVAPLGVGIHQVEARFSGPTFGPSSDEVEVEVTRAPTTVSLVLDPDGTSAYGEGVGAEVQVTADVAPAAIAGFVVVKVDGEPVGTVAVTAGEASFTLPDLAAGEHDVVAVYGGDPAGNLEAGSSSVITHEVMPAPVAVELTGPGAVIASGQEVELVATATRTTEGGSGDPTGTVTFTADGVEVLGTAPLVDGMAVLATDALDEERSWSIVASYDGDDHHMGGESDPYVQVVRGGTTVDVTPPPTATGLGDPATFDVAVTPVSGSAVPVGTVRLRLGDATLAEAVLAAGEATLVTRQLRAGEHDLVVEYLGDTAFAPGWSAPIPHEVQRSASELLLSANPEVVAEGRPVTVVARVQGDAMDVARPTGFAVLSLPGEPLRTVALSPAGVASWRVTGLPLGTHVLSVSYAGDADHTEAAPEAVEVEVVPVVDVAFTIDPVSGTGPLEVTAEATDVPVGADLAWDFGDGTTATGATATHTYDAPGTYTVTLTADAGVATGYASRRVVVGEEAPLTAEAGADQTVADGVAALLDGRRSTPQPGITSWLWELGDGATAADPVVSHTYATPGTYLARLTVTGEGGETATDEVVVVVEPVESETGLRIHVEGSAGPLAGADVLVVDGRLGEYRGATGSDGAVVLAGLADHTYTVYAVAPGHRPGKVEATVVDGFGEASLTLSSGAQGVTQLDSRELTAAEVVAAGLDPEDPANNHVYAFEIWLDFEQAAPSGSGGGGGRRVLVNSDGEFVHPGCEAQVCRITGGGSRATGRVSLVDGKPAITWLVMPGQAQWLKDFFEVELVMQNLTDPDFAFEDGAAVIHLPPGLSLAALTEPQSTVVEMDPIVGGSSRKVRWILRGDVAGSYDVEAEYTASLYPLGTSVRLSGGTAEPLRVWGADALEMEVVADDEAFPLSPYQARVEITNVADVPVHNLALDLFDEGTVGFIYQPRQQNRFVTATLDPGGTTMAEAVLVPRGLDELDVADSFVEQVGGSATLPATVTSMPALPVEARPELCVAGSSTDADGVCELGDSPLGEVPLTWEPTGGTYRVYRSSSSSAPFPNQPLVETSATSYRYRSVPGEAGFFAVTTVAPDGTEEMLHNAVAASTGNRSSARLDLLVECGVSAGPVLQIDYADDWYPVEQYRVVTDLDPETGDPGPGQYLGGGPLAGQEGSVGWEVSSAVFDAGPHITTLPTGDGGTVDAALIYVQIRNVHDGIWADPRPVLVFPDCDEPFEGVPAEQTYGSGCKSEEYWAKANVEGANPSRCEADPVNTATGSLVATAGDLALPAPGVAFEMARTYNSADATPGPLGPGWTHAYNASLILSTPGVVTFRAHDGQQIDHYEDEDDPRSGDWFKAPAGYGEIEQTPTPIECGGCTYILRQRDQVILEFDADGHLLRIRDRDDNGLTFTNDLSGRPLSAVDAAGRTVTFAYRVDGLLESVTLPDSRSVSYGYTGGLLTTVLDAKGGTTTYRYEDGLLVEETNPRGHRVHLTTYDEVTGRAVHQEDGLGRETTWTWDAGTGTSTMTDSEGGVWVDRYRDNRLMSSTDPLGRTTSFVYDARANVIQTVDADGLATTQSYDDRGNLLRTTGPAPLRLSDSYTYDEMNNRTSWTNPNGDTVTYDYDNLGRIEAIDGPGARSITSSTGADGLLDWTEDAEGNRTDYGYDADGNLTSECTPLEHCTTKGYDGAGRLLWVVGPNGNASGGDPLDHRVSFTYDAADTRLTETDPLGNVTTYTPDANGNITTVEHPDGRTVTMAYDAADQLVSESVEGAPPTTYEYDGRGNLVARTSPEGRTTTWTYDGAGQMTSMTDGEGHAWTYGYDERSRLVTVRDPAGGVARNHYDAAGRVVRQVDPTGAATTFAYDGMGWVTRMTDPTGATTRTTYEPDGSPATVTDPAGGVTTYGYDTLGRPVTVTSPSGAVTETVYDDDGRVTATIDPRGAAPGAVPEDFTTHYVHDAAGNLTSVVDPLDEVTTYVVDPMGRVLTVTDAEDLTTVRAYDEVGRLVEVTAPDESVTRWEYDTAGDLVERIEPDDNATTYTYDDDHLLLTEEDPLGRVWSRTYDGNGRVVTTTDAIGNAAGPGAPVTTTSSYDGRGLLLGLDHTDPGTPDVSFGYDAAGRRTTMRDGDGVETSTYDRAGRLLRTVRGAERFTYAYDGAGRLVATTYPDGTRIDSSYDRDGRLRTVTSDGQRTTYGYAPGGLLTSTELPNGVVEAIEHDAAGRPVELTATHDTDPVTHQVRTYDAIGRVTSDETPAGTWTYAHDERGRLVDICEETCTPGPPATRYGYDDAGNRLSVEEGGTTAMTSTYDDADQMLDRTSPPTAAVGVVHDGNGNVVDDGQRAYRYDAAGRLVEVSVSDPATSRGTVTGTVTDPLGAPIEGVVVRAYAPRRAAASATTGADGTYELTGLPMGAYDLYFDDLGRGDHRSAWYGGSTVPEGAVPVEVAGGATSTADAVLAEEATGGELNGVVTDAEGQPVEGALVTARTVQVAPMGPSPVEGHPLGYESGIGGLSVRPTVDGQWAMGDVMPAREGQPVALAVQVTNTGLRPLANVVVSFGPTPLSCAADDGNQAIDVLPVGASVACTATITAASGQQVLLAQAAVVGGATASERSGYFGYGACTITGTEGPDVIIGTSNGEVICGLGGDDELYGLGDDDVLLGGPGADLLVAGNGKDIVIDGEGDDDDELQGTGGVDRLYASGGDDVLTLSGSGGTAFGGDGNDTMTSAGGSSVMYGGEGTDTLTGSSGTDFLRAGPGGGVIRGHTGVDALWGGSGVDDIAGGRGSDEIYSEDGGVGDLLQGGPDADLIQGGPGAEEIEGGDGADQLFGGGGADTFTGAVTGVDTVFAGMIEVAVTTDAAGRWSMVVPDGSYEVAFSGPGVLGEMWEDTRWAAERDPVRLLDDGEVTLDASLALDGSYVAPPPPPPPSEWGDPGEVLARYTYDGLGNRLTATTFEGTTRSSWDRVSGRARLATESGPGGDRSVVWGLGPVSFNDDDGSWFLHGDLVGSVVAMTDETGGVVGRWGFAPFGERVWSADVDASAPSGPFGFAGEQFDAATGLVYLRARWYDPVTGRFTQRDPAGPVAGVPHESTYLYAGGSPLTMVDPSGLRMERAARDRAWLAANQQAADPLSGLWGMVTDPHVLLDAMGMVPVVGELADMTNAVLYAVEGDWANAALSMMSIVPVVGSAASGSRLIRYADEAVDAAGMVTRHGDEVAEGATLTSRLRSQLDNPTTRTPPRAVTGARGPSSGRMFDPHAAGGPIRSLDASRARINSRGTDLVELHLKRFADGGQIAEPEAEMLGRLRKVSSGEMSASIQDQNFYTHELREMVRYRQLGFRDGQPSGGAGYDLWNNAHTATLEDYGVRDADLFHPGVGR